jgi:hypothetical protein
LVADTELRVRLGAAATATIADRFSDWTVALGGIHDILSDPEGWVGPVAGADFP